MAYDYRQPRFFSPAMWRSLAWALGIWFTLWAAAAVIAYAV